MLLRETKVWPNFGGENLFKVVGSEVHDQEDALEVVGVSRDYNIVKLGREDVILHPA